IFRAFARTRKLMERLLGFARLTFAYWAGGTPEVWLRAADCGIALSCYLIAGLLLYFTRQRPVMPVRRELRLLAATLVGYGTLQLMPSAGPAAAVRVIAAAALLMAGVQLWRSHPKVLVLRSPVELEDARRQLERQIAERKAAEEKLVRAAA